MEFNVNVLNPARNTKVVIAKASPRSEMAEAVYKATRKTIELLLEHDSSFRKVADSLGGKTALVKPNLTKHPPTYSPHNKICTDPYACKAVVDWLLEQGVERIYIGECNSWGTEKAYKLAGYYDVFKGYGDKLEIVDLRTRKRKLRDYVRYRLAEDVYRAEDIEYLRGYVQARHATLLKFGKSKRVNLDLAVSSRYGFNKLLREIDFMVNVPKLKTQVQAVVSLSIKNMFGLLEPIRAKHARHLGLDPVQEDISRRELLISYVNLSRGLVGLAAAIRSLGFPILHLVEGGVAMEGNGPLEHGEERNEYVAAAVFDKPASLDAVLSAFYMQFTYAGKPYIPYHVSLASRNGMGTVDLDEVSIVLAGAEREPETVKDLVGENGRPFKPPASLDVDCAPPYRPGETLLELLSRMEKEFEEKGVDIDAPVVLIKEKTTPEVVEKGF